METSQNTFEEIYCHLGHWDYNGIGEQLYLIGDIIENQNVNRFTLKRIIFCALEMMENVFHHSGQSKYDTENNSHQSEFRIHTNEQFFRLCSGNIVHNADMDALRKRLQEVKDFDINNIRKMYINQLKYGEITKKGGAGLGIMEVAKISRNPIDYEFEKIDEDYTYLRLFAFIKKE